MSAGMGAASWRQAVVSAVYQWRTFRDVAPMPEAINVALIQVGESAGSESAVSELIAVVRQSRLWWKGTPVPVATALIHLAEAEEREEMGDV